MALIAFNPSSSLMASILLSLEEAGNSESAKDYVRYPAMAARWSLKLYNETSRHR